MKVSRLSAYVGIFALAFGIGLVNLMPQAVHAASRNSHSTTTHTSTSGYCHNVSITLNGNKAPLTHCADGQNLPTLQDKIAMTQKASNVTPDAINTGDCSSESLWIYQDANYSGARLCVRGAGQIDLGNYCPGGWILGSWCPGGTWAYAVSSYYAGCSTGRMSQANTNSYQTFGAYEAVHYVGSGFNDAIQYAELDSNC